MVNWYLFWRALPTNIHETLTCLEFSGVGAEGIDHECDHCDAIIHLGGGSDGQADAAALDRGV